MNKVLITLGAALLLADASWAVKVRDKKSGKEVCLGVHDVWPKHLLETRCGLSDCNWRKGLPMKFLAALMLAPALVQATTVFNGYEAYYQTLPNRLFQDKGIELQSYALEGDDAVHHEWHGMAADRQQRVDVRDGQLKINGRVLNPKLVKAFPDEVVSDSDLGLGTTVYFSKGWVCLENTPASASGTAVRHKAVYLIKQSGKQQRGWKLPSLFASCTAIRMQKGQVQFDKVTYRYLDGQDEPQGAMFKGYAIQGNKFVALGSLRSSTFVEPGNVYKFSVEPN